MQNITVFGIVLAVIIIMIGLRILLRKQDDAAPSLDSPLQFNPESQLPIIPRHVRDQLQHEAAIALDSTATTDTSVESQELNTASSEDISTPEITSNESSGNQTVDQMAADNLTANDTSATGDGSVESASEDIASEQTKSASDDIEQADATAKTGAEAAASAEYQLNPKLEAVVIQEYEDESSLLDKHLHEQQRFDDQSTLANSDLIISLNVLPHPRKALSGDKTLKVLLKYGLRFGEMSCFHRYEEDENGGGLMFSVLRVGDEGPHGFDLEGLSCEQVQGLAFFLALPHRNVQKGFDTMVSIAGLIAREIDGTVYDENNLEFTPQLKEHWRHKAIDYRRQK